MPTVAQRIRGGRLGGGGKRGVAGLILGSALVGVLAYTDAVAAREAVIGTVVIGPLVCALLGTARQVALVGALALLAALLSPTWNNDVDAGSYVLRSLIVGLGSLVAVIAAARTERVVEQRKRFEVLAAVADVADGTLSLEETAQRIAGIAVPALADGCAIDVLAGGQPRRIAQLGAEVPAVPPDGVEPHRVTVSLDARGRRLGKLTLVTGGARTLGEDEGEFTQVLAGRVALALDNAGLYAELETIEGQLSAAMASLGEAVTIQRAEGVLIYANDAAARMMGFSSPQEMLATPVGQIAGSFDSFKEDGTPLRMEDLPGRRLLAGQDAPPLALRVINRETGEERWRVTKASPVRDREGAVKLVVNVIEDVTEVKRAELRQRLLAETGNVLASSLDYETTLQQVADLAVPVLADWCSVAMPDGKGFIRTVAVAHSDPAMVEFAARFGERYPSREDDPAGLADVLRSGETQLINDISAEMLRAGAKDEEHAEMLLGLGMRAAISVPMLAAGRVIGTMSLVSSESQRTFTEADAELARELAARAGTAVENARLYTERSHIARTLQRELLPSDPPDIPGWAVATHYRPAGSASLVGGDFYEAIAVEGGWLAIVGDVAGRGVEAASLTGMARHTLRSVAKLLDDPLAALTRLNDELLEREQLSLVTVVAVLLREESDGSASAEVICAGHPRPLLLHGGVVEQVGNFGPILGAGTSPEWQRAKVAVPPGGVLVLYTDGVLDCVGADGVRFGDERLASAVAGASGAPDVVARIGTALTDFQRGEETDDTAVLALERL